MPKKPFKDEKPLNTIKNIKNILYNLDISLEEYYFKHNSLHASTIKISNNNLGLLTKHISTNGKGKSKEYSLASAYGEFMERLQNGILIDKLKYAHVENKKNNLFSKTLKEKDGFLDFLFDPKEIKIKSEEYIAHNKDFLFELLETNEKEILHKIIIKDLNFKELVCVPFYNQKNSVEVYLPIELIFKICGSSGMCAGNTPQEAIIQGICEILERYVLKELYIKKITPPTIPKEQFKDFEVLNIVKKIESTGLTITIKDLSLNKKLPVIGVLIVDKKNYKYNFKAGSDVRPEIALERCLTEFHQTSNKIRMNNIIGWTNIEIDENKYSDILNFSDLIQNSSGHQKKELFASKPTYPFETLNFTLGQSHNLDLEFLKKTINNLKKKIFIRDVSFLGFPSYHIVIPGLSKIKYLSNEDFSLFSDFYKIKEDLLNIKLLDKKEFKKLVLSIEKWQKIYSGFWFKILKPTFLPHLNNDVSNLEVNLFLGMSFYKLKDNKKAAYYLDAFLDAYPNEKIAFLYFYAFRDFIRLKIDKKTTLEIKDILNAYYEDFLVEEIIKDLENPETIFSDQALPTCFNCERCEVFDTCKYFDVMSIVKKVHLEQKKNKISQIHLVNII